MFRRIGRIILLAGLLFLLLLPAVGVQAQSGGALVMTVKGPITPVLAGYLERGLQAAAMQGAEVVIVQLNTPGGSVDVMNRMVSAIRNSEVPVVVYVSPRNSMAASAGSIITLAGHLAAMAPETTIGAASPVGSQGEDIGTTMESKVKEILKASVRAITSGRSPQAVALAEDMIENARAVTVDEALAVGLVDFKAVSVEDLLVQLDGRTLETAGGSRILHTAGISQVDFKSTIIEDILQLLVDPNLVFLLLSVGIQAVLIEISSPGGWVAGFIGAVCIILAIYGMGILPVNWFGILFLVVAFILFIVDIKAPTHGALTAAGAGSFIAGALVLFNSTRLPGFPTLSVPLVVGTAIVMAASFFAIVTFAIRAQRKPVLTGKEAIMGRVGLVRTRLEPRGIVHVAGEQWGAIASPDDAPIEVGERVEVTGVDGLNLLVRRAK